MGIYMHLLVSSAVTPNEWQAAYQETLKLVWAFSLGELREKEVADVPVYCLTPTEERTQPAAWRKNGAWTGWTANGDRLTLRTAEEYCLPRDLENELAYDPAGGDAALAHAANVLFRDKTPSLPTVRHLWGGKTQGELPHRPAGHRLSAGGPLGAQGLCTWRHHARPVPQGGRAG